MAFLRGLLWLLCLIAFLAVSVYLAGNDAIADRLTGLFFLVQSWPALTSLRLDQFLIGLTVTSLLLAIAIVSLCAAAIGLMAGRLSVARQREVGQAAAAKREVDLIQGQHRAQDEQLLALGQALTKRLDKRVLIQGIVEAASRIMSVPQANSLASCWLLNFETDTFRFEMGRYCDEALFSKAEFQPNEQPFARVLSTQKAVVLPSAESLTTMLKPEKARTLGSATGAILVPMVIEDSVLGILLLLCHPDVLKSYEERKTFYDALWGELALALAIAIQGAVAILDRLTGAHNREYFMKRLIQEIERANRFQLPLSLLMVDIDNFKAVNDTLGHPQGDAVLKIVSKLIRKEVRAIDLVGRYGGEEFIIMLPETGYGEAASPTAPGALIVAERIRKAVDDEFHGLQKPLNLTVSIGVAVRRFPEEREQDYRELLRLADEQLYRAKTTGKNKVCVFEPEKPQEVP
jgi:diguanylate cyclase (GGDEF)-like protein